MEQPSGRYARALRAIGQDLADLIPDNLTIEPDGDNLVTDGICSRNRLETQETEGSLTGLKKIGAILRAGILKSSSGEPDLDMVNFHRSYTPDDIDQLDKRGNTQRHATDGIPEIYNLSERLRTIGKVIDGDNGEIVRIFKDLHHIVFEYRDGNGATRKHELDNTELYRLQRTYSSERTDTKVPNTA